MSDIDTRRTGGSQTASFATVRLESCNLTTAQLIDLLVVAAEDSTGVDLHIEDQGVCLTRSFSCATDVQQASSGQATA